MSHVDPTVEVKEEQVVAPTVEETANSAVQEEKSPEKVAENIESTDAAGEKPEEETPQTNAVDDEKAAVEEENAKVEEEKVKAEVEEKAKAEAEEAAQLNELRTLINARKAAIAAAKAALEGRSSEESEQQLWAVKAKHQAAVKESNDLEKKRAEAEPEYERLKENADMRETALKLAEDIETNEAALAAEEEKAVAVEAECKETTALYAEESKRSATFINTVQQRIDQLHEAFSQKIALTSKIDPDGYEAFDHLQDVSVAVMARGKQLSTLTKVLREQHCLLEINATRKANVNSDFESQNIALLRQKDEQIRDAVFRYQDERAKLHHDIEDMQRINKEQAIALKSGDVQKKQDKIGNIGLKTTQSTRFAAEQSALDQDVEALQEKVALAKADIAAALEGIRAATKVKSDLIKEEKTLQTRQHWDKTHQDADIAAIVQSTQVATQAKLRQERENEKLAENIRILTKQVKRLKEAADTIENRTKPLPVE